jgi:hypothetical protein
VFKNYFAFDDGSSEGGYGINGLGSRNAMLAYRFTSFIKDTVRAVGICFNDSYLDANKRSFDIMIWDDNNGVPGDVLYTKESVIVSQGDVINGYHYYIVPDGIMVNGVFYVGWRQKSETFLNAGLDLNTPHRGRQLFYINGAWNTSEVGGSVMIRPVVGDRIKVTAIGELKEGRKKFNLWPNPAQDFIIIDYDHSTNPGLIYVSIIDLTGHELLKVPYSERINISGLKRGIYIVITSVNGIPAGYNRLIKSK